jgi:hypothetical protein
MFLVLCFFRNYQNSAKIKKIPRHVNHNELLERYNTRVHNSFFICLDTVHSRYVKIELMLVCR